MSLAFVSCKNLCNRKDGIIDSTILSLSFTNQIYLNLALVTPYSVNSKTRKANQNKKIADQKGIKTKVKFPTVEKTNNEFIWNKKLSFNVDDLTTVNFIQIECWGIRHIKSDSLVGYCKIPITSSYIETNSKISFSLCDIKKEDNIVGEINLKLQLKPSAPGLEQLSFREENFNSFPSFIVDSFWLPRILKSLTLYDCNITEIPKKISDLSAIKKLNLPKNKITEIPEFISSMLSLEEIDLSSNLIEKIPSSLACLPNLKVLNIIDNPLISIPDEFTDKGDILKTNFLKES